MNEKKMRAMSWIGDKFVSGPIKAVIVNFHGLGSPGMKTAPNYEEHEWAAAGGLVLFPYPGPWSWMNRNARAIVDELIDAVYEHFALDASTPLIIVGGSMGGQCSLLYTRYAKRPVKACEAIFPVCDLKYHFSERDDLPRTFYQTFYGYPEDFESILEEHSPVEQVPHMPRIPYLFMHGDADTCVNKQAHSDKMVEAMRKHDFNVEYMEVPGQGHDAPLYFYVYRRLIDFVKEQFA